MSKIARVGDTGQGVCRAGHTGIPMGIPKPMITTFTTGTSTVFLNNKPLALQGTEGVTDCGHHTVAVSFSPTVFAENIPLHRLGDTGIVIETGSGEYTTITASPDTDG